MLLSHGGHRFKMVRSPEGHGHGYDSLRHRPGNARLFPPFRTSYPIIRMEDSHIRSGSDRIDCLRLRGTYHTGQSGRDGARTASCIRRAQPGKRIRYSRSGRVCPLNVRVRSHTHQEPVVSLCHTRPVDDWAGGLPLPFRPLRHGPWYKDNHCRRHARLRRCHEHPRPPFSWCPYGTVGG